MWWVYYLVKRNAYKRLSHEFHQKEGQIRLTESVGHLERGKQNIVSCYSPLRTGHIQTGQLSNSKTAQCNDVACYTCPENTKRFALQNRKTVKKINENIYPAHGADGIFMSSKFDICLSRSTALLVTNVDTNGVQRMKELNEKEKKINSSNPS